MLPPFKAAAIQFEPTLFEKDANIDALLQLVESAAIAGAKLITTPEMATTGYCWYDRDEITPYVEPVPGVTTERFAALARRYDCYIVVGMPEIETATRLYYNSAVLVGPDGIIGTHRKTHSYISEPKWAAAGDLGHRVFETPVGRIAMLICMDIHFVETARLAGLGGADVICHISNWLAERTPAPYWINRAFENSCYLMESNRWGLERGVQFSGGSCVIAPDASILAVVDNGNGIAEAVIDPALARERKVWGEPIMEQRRPELYTELMTNTFLWNPNDFFGLYGYRTRPAGDAVKVAVAEFVPEDNIAANLRAIRLLTDQAKQEGAQLVVFPERALTGLARSAMNACAIDGIEIAELKALSATAGIAIIVGFAERNGECCYNSAAFLDSGALIGCYRQVHRTMAEREWASVGSEWKVFDLPFGRVGLLIGHDASFPESGRILALRGCDIIACPSAITQRFHSGHDGTSVRQADPIPTCADPLHWHQYRVRAGENNVYFLFANICQTNGKAGFSGVFGPDTFAFPRNEAIISDNARIAVAEIDTRNADPVYPTSVVRRKDLIVMRQTHHYGGIVALESHP